MITPIVKELPRRLEPVTRDPFLDHHTADVGGVLEAEVSRDLDAGPGLDLPIPCRTNRPTRHR
jgi:hypothetical protein